MTGIKAREFWPEIVTQKSWEKLVSLSKEYDFIVIGGWTAGFRCVQCNLRLVVRELLFSQIPWAESVRHLSH